MTIGNIIASIQLIISLTFVSQGKATACVTVTADNENFTEKIKVISGTKTENKQVSLSCLLLQQLNLFYFLDLKGQGR